MTRKVAPAPGVVTTSAVPPWAAVIARDDRQAEAGATARAGARRVGAPELLEDVGRFVGAECRARCRSPRSTASVPRIVDTDPHRRAVRRVRARVREQVGEHLAQAAFVADDRRDAVRRRPRRCGPGARRAASAAASAARRVRSTDWCSSGRPWSSRASRRRSSTSTPMRVASSSMRCIAFARSSGRSVGAAPEQLGVAADRRERRAQLVRRVGDELSQPRFGRVAFRERPLDLSEHAVEGEAEPADLGLLGRRARRAATGRRPRSRRRCRSCARAAAARVRRATSRATPSAASTIVTTTSSTNRRRSQRPVHVVERERDDERVAVRDAFARRPRYCGPSPAASTVNGPSGRFAGRCGRCGVEQRRVVPAHQRTGRVADLGVAAGREHARVALSAITGRRSARRELLVDAVVQERAQRCRYVASPVSTSPIALSATSPSVSRVRSDNVSPRAGAAGCSPRLGSYGSAAVRAGRSSCAGS